MPGRAWPLSVGLFLHSYSTVYAESENFTGISEEPVPRNNCGVWNDTVRETVETCSFWMEGVILTATGLFGIVGNALSVFILSKPDMYNSFNQLLITLSCLDSGFIIFAILDYSMARAFSWKTSVYIFLFPYLVYPFHQISFCASIFVTIALAYERYNAVCHPLHYRNLTARYSVRRRTLGYLLPVCVASFLMNIPKFMETKLVWKTEFVPESNQTITRIDYAVTDLRNDPNYIRFYINWTWLIATGLIPMGSLVYFNSRIFRGIQMTHERTRKKNKQRAGEMNMAAILLCIVFLFLICHFLRILLNVHEFFMLEDMLDCGNDFAPPVWFFCVTSFNHWMLIINASFNFLIYCSVGTKFKTGLANFYDNKLFQILRRKSRRPREKVEMNSHPSLNDGEEEDKCKKVEEETGLESEEKTVTVHQQHQQQQTE